MVLLVILMKYNILLDTNVIILREDNEEIHKDVQNLLKILSGFDFQLFVHQESFNDIKRDKDAKRRDIILSKMNSYLNLESNSSFEDDKKFKSTINYKENSHDFVDNSLLYSLFRDEVTFLITEDNGIHKNARKLNQLKENFSDRVFTIKEAINFFEKKSPVLPYEIIKTTVDSLDIDDAIFNTLKEDYEEFPSWFSKIQYEKRDCLIFNKTKDSLGALLIYKEENESIYLKNKILPGKNRTKIATMKVSSTGYKIGEFFLSWIIEYSLKRNIEEIYLTHFVKGSDDPLIYLIKEYGFEYVGNNSRGEEVYIKNLNSNIIESEIKEKIGELSNVEISKKFYPYFYDGKNINKYIVPIREEFHKKLFLSNQQQTNLNGFFDEEREILDVSKNVIKKAYLSKSNININNGDILLFYESNKKGISEIGIVESFSKDLSFEEINKKVGKRSVYSPEELEKFSDRNIVILFIYSKKGKKIPLDVLVDKGIIKGPPQSIQGLNHDKYLKLKELLK